MTNQPSPIRIRKLPLRRIIRLSILLPFLTFTVVNAQNLRFKNLSVAEGLCHPFVYNINQDKDGFIWIGTGEGLCRYDGFTFTSEVTGDSLPSEVVNASLRDSLGNLWIGYNNGQVWSYDGNYFEKHLLPVNSPTSISGLTEYKDGSIIVATQNMGLFRLRGNGKFERFTPSFSHQIISAIFVHDNLLFLGTQNGLMYYNMSNTKDTTAKAVSSIAYTKVQVIKQAFGDNSFWVGTEDAGLFLVKVENNKVVAQNVGGNKGLAYENVQDVSYDSESNLWISTYTSGLIKAKLNPHDPVKVVSFQKYDKDNGLSTNFVKSTFIDQQGNLWVGTYGSGIYLLTNIAFSFQTFDKTPLGNDILSVAINDSLLWLGGDTGLMEINQTTHKQVFYSTANGLPKDQIISLYYKNGILWVGTSNNGIYKHIVGTSRFTSFFKTDNTISNVINYLMADAENVYAATKNGIFIINIKTGSRDHYSTLKGLPHNDIEYIFLDSDNRLLFATRTNGIYEINEKGDVGEVFTVGKYELDFNSITQDKHGNIWVSTYGEGVFLLKTDTIINLTVRNGLKSNYCYSITAADSNYIWVGHRLGMSRIDINNLSISLFDANQGITGDCNQNAVKVSKSGVIYFGTSDGLVTYKKKTGSKKFTPKTNILKVFISDKEYDIRKPIVLPYSAYKLRIDYIGLNYSDPGAVKYQYKLEGYDLEWSDITSSREAVYPRVEDGNYTFMLRSYGSDGQTQATPVTFSIRIKLPVWKTWWFISLATIIIVLVVIVIIKFRERKQKQIQEYLEERLDERTREVVEQKEEIEIKNRDITDSINYAQRIQASILPPIKRLQQNFSGSFIFYQPRDIVSGDFYWFDRINENKFVIVCADSTGHGVPGAFMSMIGTTLIKDICNRSDINSPSAILAELDTELRNTLNQNLDAEKSNDGMDIIVCEIDVKTLYLRYASAMRPMIVFKDGSLIYVKGSRSSVGGQYDKDDKEFRDEGIQLDKGDLIYMFSDGYPDQFGGPVGKKFKMVRMKNLLHDIYQKPMEEQYEYVKSTFNLWKENYEQVDDVLFMGIKI